MGVESARVRAAVGYAEGFLDSGIPEELHYHSPEHTQRVKEAAVEIARGEGLSAEEIGLVEVAAAFHDIGHVSSIEDGPENHEQRSIEIASRELEERGFRKDEIDRVVQAIDATDLNTEPESEIGGVLSDADLYHLGTDRFILGDIEYRRETREALGEDMTVDEWYEQTLDFLRSHEFHTDTAQDRYGELKQENLRNVEDLVGIFDVLGEIYDRLEREDVDWAVFGSTNLVMQEVPVDISEIDLDILTDEEGADFLYEAFSEHPEAYGVKEPEWSEQDGERTYIGSVDVKGVEVDIQGSPEFRDEGESFDASEYDETVELSGDREVPVMPLGEEGKKYELRGDEERAGLVEEYGRL